MKRNEQEGSSIVPWKDANLIDHIRAKFKSGNEIPVPEVRLTHDEWEAVERALEAGARLAFELVNQRIAASIIADIVGK